jgi:hypothetical protein
LSQGEVVASAEDTSGTVRIRGMHAYEVEVGHRHADLQKQIDELRFTVDRLILEISSIRGLLEASPVRVRIVETREVTIEKAKEMIMKYMDTHDIIYPDDIADELGLDLKITIEAVNELIKEGKVKESDEE